MGTRGCVAVGNPQKWVGLYNHWDSYPTALGADVWAEWKKNPNLPKDLLNFDDWRSYLNGGICEYCGKKAGQPHSILLNEFTQVPGQDPDALYHKHNSGNPTEHHLDQDNADPLFIEWVYILDVENQAIHILSHFGKSDYYRSANSPVPGHRQEQAKVMTDDGFVDYGHCAYKHVLCYTIFLTTPEPNWAQIENAILRDLYPEDFEDE